MVVADISPSFKPGRGRVGVLNCLHGASDDSGHKPGGHTSHSSLIRLRSAREAVEAER